MACVALTFDDGPSEWTTDVLDVLVERDAHATFFVIGSSVEGREDVLRRMVADGHEIGTHTWSHASLTVGCDEARIRDELERGCAAIEAAGVPRPVLYRAPYNRVDEHVEAVARSLGLTHVPIEIGPPDWHPRWTPSLTVTFVAQQVTDGAVIGLHDGLPPQKDSGRETCRPTVDALRLLLPLLAERGFRAVTASVTKPAAVA